MARAALGLPNPQKCSHRNRFFVAPDGEKHAAWRALVLDGKARLYHAPEGQKLDLFCLTITGAREALNVGESLDREDFPNA